VRDIRNGGHEGEARATCRHIQDFAANGLRVFPNDYPGGAMHRVSRASSVFRWPYNHRSRPRNVSING
jgi:hypothetical protein